MNIKTLGTVLLIGTSIAAAHAATAKERCFTRQQTVCTYGPKHGTHMTCTTKSSVQCFQVPELRGDKTKLKPFRRK